MTGYYLGFSLTLPGVYSCLEWLVVKFKHKNFNAVNINLLTPKKKFFSPSIGSVEMLSLLSDCFNMERLIG